MNRTYDVAVVGAGIVGLAHAAAAHARGLDVVVVDRAERPNGSTVRNFGHVGVSVQAGVAREHAERSRELLISYAQRVGFWLARRGTVIAATADDEMQVLRESGEGRLLSAREVGELTPVSGAVGGALLKDDMQVSPRELGPALAAWLQRDGVDIRWGVPALGAETGVLHTARGEIRAEAIVFCVGPDLDHVLPDVARRAGIERCGLDMLLAGGIGLEFPVLTGTSMLRYSAFRETPSYEALRTRMENERPDVIDLDVNQMYTEAPGLGLFVGDTHYVDRTLSPFQDERAFDLLIREAKRLFGLTGLAVLQRWQGVYAKGPGEFLEEQVSDGVFVSSVTTGIGMTTALGFGERVVEKITSHEGAR